jgi:Phage terminase, small subunit
MAGQPKTRGVRAKTSGLDARGKWKPAFPGQRPPFEKGHALRLTHGAQSMIRLAPRAAELADDLRVVVPAVSDADEPTIRLLALVLARVEVANEWLAEHGIFKAWSDEVQPVLKVLSTWENTAARLCDRLGLTPTSRAALGLDLARSRGELLRADLVDQYASGESS